MKYQEAIKRRMELERKYLSMAINKKRRLQRTADGRKIAPSPASYQYLNENGCRIEKDCDEFSYYSDVIHDEGARAEIENELLDMGIKELVSYHLYSNTTYYYSYGDEFERTYYSVSLPNGENRNWGTSVPFMYLIQLFLSFSFDDMKLGRKYKLNPDEKIEVKGYTHYSVYHEMRERRKEMPSINKAKYNRMVNLCKLWREKAQKEHYKIEGVHKRLIKKYGL